MSTTKNATIKEVPDSKVKATDIQPKYPRHTQKILKGNFAAAEGAKICRAGFIPAYPITPQTTIVEELSVLAAREDFDTTFINMDSEHSVFAAALGASMVGERVFTATSGQGLFYAHEALHAIAHFRQPVVVCNVGRPSIPWNIWSDQSDSLAQRDTGWIQLYGESSQEVLDSIIQAYKVAEQLDIPVLVVLDAFYQSHTSENVWMPDIDLVDEFLPPRKFKGSEIDTNKPKAYGGLVPPDQYDKFNYKYWQDIKKAEGLINSTGSDFEKHFGRRCAAVEAVNIHPGTKMILVTLSTITTTVRGVIKSHPDVGLLKIRLFKPFPKKSVLNVLQDVSDDCIIVNIERNFMGDNEGALMMEMKRALYMKSFKIYDVYAGVGGRDVPPATIEKIIEYGFNDPVEVKWIDLE
ncbi:MAG: pyruvate ferredoxin oxidoreductase [Bacteroidota bacterium]